MVERKHKTLSVKAEYHTALRKEAAELGVDIRTLVTFKIKKTLSKEDKLQLTK